MSVRADSCYATQFFKLHTKAYTDSFLQLMLRYLFVKSNVKSKLFYVNKFSKYMAQPKTRKPDFNRLGAKLQQAGKIDNFQKSQ